MQNNLLNKYLNSDNKNRPNKNKAHAYVTKILICIIILLVSLIVTSFSPKIKRFYEKYLFSETFNFMKFKDFYESFAGKSKEEDKESLMAMKDFLEYKESKPYQDGYLISGINTNLLTSLASGIVVYAGEKENYGKTIIIQGSNGFDIWYAGVESIDINIYDYVKKGDQIASLSGSLILVIKKGDKNYTYEEYLNENK